MHELKLHSISAEYLFALDFLGQIIVLETPDKYRYHALGTEIEITDKGYLLTGIRLEGGNPAYFSYTAKGVLLPFKNATIKILVDDLPLFESQIHTVITSILDDYIEDVLSDANGYFRMGTLTDGPYLELKSTPKDEVRVLTALELKELTGHLNDTENLYLVLGENRVAVNKTLYSLLYTSKDRVITAVYMHLITGKFELTSL